MTDDRDPEARATHRLHDGYSLAVVGPERKLLRLVAPDGRICLSITLLPGGPAVEVAAASLAIATEGDVSVDCERFQVNARGDVALVAGGDIVQRAGADITARAEGEIVTEGVAQRHSARLGNIDLTANDDVSLRGERVRLNSPDLRAAPSVALSRTVRKE